MRFQYICSDCGKHYEISPEMMVCPICCANQDLRKPLRGILEVALEGEVTTNFDIFDLLPVERKYFPDLLVGNTPLFKPERLNKSIGFDNLYIKNDSLNPTGSLKDRASYLVAAFTKKHGIKDIVLASTGNAGSSMAGIGASADLNVFLFLPKDAPSAKLVQAIQYGADVRRVNGNYDMAYGLSMKYVAEHGGLSRNTAYNPMTIEGKKTIALEMFKQMGTAPDYVFVPVGDGVIVSGVFKGFKDLYKLGLIKKMPIIVSVQAEGSSAIAQAVEAGDFGQPVESDTVADSISVDVPRGGYYALRQIKEFDGICSVVSDDAILKAQMALSRSGGVFAEPAAAASYAGFLKEKDKLPKDAKIVVLITGHGLKDIASASKEIEIPEKLYESSGG